MLKTILRDVSIPAWFIMAAVTVASVFGTLDAAVDADHARDLGILPIAGPAIVAAYLMIELIFSQREGNILLSLLNRTIILTLPAALLCALAAAITGSLPAVQSTTAAAMAANRGFHYWAADGLFGWGSFWLTLFGGYALGGVAGLFVFVVITLPLVFIFAGHRTEGIYEATASGSTRSNRAMGVAVSLCMSFLFAGIALVVFSGRRVYGTVSERVNSLFETLRTGYEPEYIWWGVGWILIFAGVLALMIGVWNKYRAKS